MQGGGRDTTLMEFPIPRGLERARSRQRVRFRRLFLNEESSRNELWREWKRPFLRQVLWIPFMVTHYLMSKAALNRNIPQIGFIENSFIGIL